MSINLLFLLLVLFVPAKLAHSLDAVFNDDVLGLIVFKAGIQDPKAKLVSWNEDDDNPCNWVGVHCDPRTNRVSGLALDGFFLSGHVGRGLLRLQFLKKLSLSNNNFTGTINPELSELGSLQLIDLSHNSLSGSIPEKLFQQCSSLRVVSFARNNLTGHIPDSLSSCFSLTWVNLSSNHLSGRLPPGLWYLRGLQLLDLSDNLLEGEITQGINNLYDLRFISFRGNHFSGVLPADIGRCLMLKVLDFSHNFLSGWLPDSMQRLSSCSCLSLGGNFFMGEAPNWIGEMRNLTFLDLSSNNFSGQIPTSIGNLRLMEILNLSMNGFSGRLPESIMSNCTKLLALDVSHNLLEGGLFNSVIKQYAQGRLQVLDLSSNSFYGKLPINIGALSGLQLLNISRNNLFGPIPRSIGELKTTNIIDLSENHLNGSIPSEIGGTISLKELRLQNNYITGKIPAQIYKCSSLKSLILSQNNLTGPIPSTIANLTHLQYVDFSFNQLSGSLPKELTNLSHLIFFNVSHNHLQGELPVGGFFNTISPSSISSNPSLCGSVVNRSCPAVHPKPIVLNPNSSYSAGGSSSANRGHRKIILSISTLIAIGAAAFITLGVLVVTVLNIHVRSSMSHSAPSLALSGGEAYNPSSSNDPKYGKLVMFSGDADFIAGAQELLNKDCELGRGGFGVVYRTVLRDGRSVAIKKLIVSSLIKSQEDFETEVKKLGSIRHYNLVALEGYYWTPSLQLLIYEFITNDNLYKHLHDGTLRTCLSWQHRFNIILGMAKGLAHLHQMGIIHYNLKSTNVMINSLDEPKIGDFGLARLLPLLDRCILSSKIQSALGYMAPEFACQTVLITDKCDVYGFGILVLEVVTGKMPVEYMEDDVVVLCDMVRGALEEGKVEECVDGRLEGIFPVEQVIPVVKLGLICASQVPSNRPDMNEVVNILELIHCPSELE